MEAKEESNLLYFRGNKIYNKEKNVHHIKLLLDCLVVRTQNTQQHFNFLFYSIEKKKRKEKRGYYLYTLQVNEG